MFGQIEQIFIMINTKKNVIILMNV